MGETNVASAVDFLKYLFGDKPNGFIYLYAEHPKKTDAKNQPLKRFLFYKTPQEVDDEWWEEWAKQFRVTYCVQTLRSRKELNKGDNVRETPFLWFDVDGCKKIVRDGKPVVTGAEFFAELKLKMPDVSAWVRSSLHGVHGFLKLDLPIEIEGDKQKFDSRVQPALLDIAWYVGADMDVATIGRLMRLPGSLNLKKEYEDNPVQATHTINREAPVHTFKDIRTKYQSDFNAVPLLVLYAITKLMQDIWTDDDHHNAMLALAGSVRKAGLDKSSCQRLFKELHVALVDSEERVTELETTYSKSLDDPLITLHAEYKQIADAMDMALTFWADLKLKYAKKRGIEWHPEVDPTQRKDDNKPFFVHEGQTWYKSEKGISSVLANFSMRVIKRIIKADDGSIVWFAEINKPGTPPKMIELAADKQISFAKFVTIKPMISGLVFSEPALWSQYTRYLDECYSDTALVKETPFYGILGVGEENTQPTVLLPGDLSDDYLWPEAFAPYDTALHGSLRRDIGAKETRQYLEKFARYYSRYQEPSYLYSALGWMCACPLTAFLRRDSRATGFPIMTVTGLKGSGKSTLLASVLGPHFGCNDVKSFSKGTTSPFAVKRRLTSNNVCPYILDEFRDVDEKRTEGIQGIILASWSGYPSESGTAEGLLRTDNLYAPLCIIGEHTFEDPATNDRIFSVRVSPSWVKHVRTFDADTKAAFEEARDWLQSPTHTGFLGTLLINYIERHLDEVDEIIDYAYKVIGETCEVTNERKRAGYATVFAGLKLLSKIYAEHGLEFFLKKSQMTTAVYGADPEVAQQRIQGGGILKTLFATTDKVIVDGIRRHASHENYLYVFDPVKTNIIYFQRSRWFDEINGLVKGSSAAALKNERGFIDLLKESVDEPDPVILSADSDKPLKGTVVVDMDVVSTRFSIDVERWKRAADEFLDA